jgi:hypothetical protein
MTISANTSQNHAFMRCFDYRMTEVRFERLSPSFLRQIGRDAREQKMLFVVTGQEERPVEEFRRAWAGSYATGNLLVVPWDQFNRAVLQDPDAQRTFIPADRLADLTAFVRANAMYLDDYEEAAVGGYDLEETRYGLAQPLTIEGGSGKLSAFVRARPGHPAAPVIVHMVEWGIGAATVIKLQTRLFFAGAPLQVRLRLPAPYDPDAHALAEAGKDYGTLIREETLTPTTEGKWTTVKVPPVEPWGMLVVEESETAGRQR